MNRGAWSSETKIFFFITDYLFWQRNSGGDSFERNSFYNWFLFQLWNTGGDDDDDEPGRLYFWEIYGEHLELI